MTKFIREIKDFDKLKDKLENDPFLIKVNKELIQKGKILLTFRNNNSTMYYKGRQFCNMRRSSKDASGNIVSYSPEINNLFLPVMRSKVLEKGKREIIGEDVYLKKTSGICSFSSVLSEILDNMDKEKDEEAFQVSNMYRFSPMVQNNSSTVILLDIEATFAETKIDRDRIDVVLYNIDEKQLIFVEVKRRSDGRLYPNPTTKARAEIFGQMESYRGIIKINKDIIVKQYNKVIDYYNILANKTIPVMDVEDYKEPLLGLLIVGCSETEVKHPEQASEEFKNMYDGIKKENIKVHLYGDTKNATSGTMLNIYKSFV